MMRMSPSPKLSLVMSLPLAVALAACADAGGDGDGDDDPIIEPVCTEPTTVSCRDQSLVALDMEAEATAAGKDITNTDEGDHFHTTVDATANGAFGGAFPYVYAKFTETGLVKVDLTDDGAFDSMDWDVAFRRFVIRLNSGVSGPSCVTGARTAPSTDFASLDVVPDNLDFNAEQYMSDTCELIPDGSGLGSPGTILQNFWTYPGCVQMTRNVYVLQLADGHHVKLVVTHFYDEQAQQDCQDTNQTDSSGSGHIQLDWAFLD
jgi:hypothetical protein